MLDDQELATIDDWRFKQRMPSRAAAIRKLLNIGLKAAADGTADPSRRSQDFGLLSEEPQYDRRTSNGGSSNSHARKDK